MRLIGIYIFLGLFSVGADTMAGSPDLSLPLDPSKLTQLIPGDTANVSVFEVSNDTSTIQTKIKTQNQLSCLQKQIAQSIKVGEIIGSSSELDSQMKKNKVHFQISNYNIISGSETSFKPAIKYSERMSESDGASLNVVLNSRLYIDRNTHLMTCDVVSAQEIYNRLTDSQKGPGLKFTSTHLVEPTSNAAH